jgi:hypothetical protein
VVRTLGSRTRAVDVGALAAHEVAGCAVLLHTGGDRDWGTPSYAEDAPYLTEAGASWLVDHGAKLVGIDSMNIDDTTSGGQRPAHSILLAAEIPSSSTSRGSTRYRRPAPGSGRATTLRQLRYLSGPCLRRRPQEWAAQ